ncbi:hypothetical protein EVAR_26560_1 [Eumeta japonica]|uniref:Uncharacterized protein n=1 Tax=Eumeta variegata TaxID=151549 RepID=A0A4C1W7J9_EUMVA|nr:hypothetical protein EVAR_26560_1 [Eumeta japonica]
MACRIDRFIDFLISIHSPSNLQIKRKDFEMAWLRRDTGCKNLYGTEEASGTVLGGARARGKYLRVHLAVYRRADGHKERGGALPAPAPAPPSPHIDPGEREADPVKTQY